MQKHVVFFDSARRLRSGWRVATFLFLYIFSTAVFALILGTVFAAGEISPVTSPERFAVSSLIGLVPALVVGWFCGKWIEGLPFKALGASFSPGWFKNLTLGLLFGAASLGLAILIAVIFGNFTFERNSTVETAQIVKSLVASLAIFAVGAAFEEALFRGYVFQTLTRAGLAWLAVILTAVFFGFVHTDNPSVGIISTIDTVIAGIIFCIAYLKTRDLWFPFGLHLMWNWLQGSFFGIEVSGLTEMSSVSILREIDNGPEWLTGGGYGIEGGIASTIALVITGIAIYFVPFIKPDPDQLRLTSPEDSKASVS